VLWTSTRSGFQSKKFHFPVESLSLQPGQISTRLNITSYQNFILRCNQPRVAIHWVGEVKFEKSKIPMYGPFLNLEIKTFVPLKEFKNDPLFFLPLNLTILRKIQKSPLKPKIHKNKVIRGKTIKIQQGLRMYPQNRGVPYRTEALGTEANRSVP
jgi:hypothetical protein